MHIDFVPHLEADMSLNSSLQHYANSLSLPLQRKQFVHEPETEQKSQQSTRRSISEIRQRYMNYEPR